VFRLPPSGSPVPGLFTSSAERTVAPTPGTDHAPASTVAPSTSPTPGRPDALEEGRLPPPFSLEGYPVEDTRAARLGLASLVLSLVGFLVVAAVLYEFKFHGVTWELGGAPTRVVFVLGILFAVAPFLLTLFRRVPASFLILPVVLIFFLYPIFNPFGIPYDRDPVYVFQFAQHLAMSGSWNPGHGVSEQGIVYSYYPGGAIFAAEAAVLTSSTLFSTFTWTTELFRLLVIPFCIYALSARLFGPKTAPLAVLLYAVTPSIEMNIPTQQDFAVTFFLLTITMLTFLLVTPARDTWPLRLTIVMSTAMVIVSHHVSTYLLLGFLAVPALLPPILWKERPFPALRPMRVFLRTVAFVLTWVAIVSLPVIEAQSVILQANLSALVHPGPAVSAIPGASFPTYQTAWISLSIAVVAVVAILALLEAKRRDDRSFVTVAILGVLLLGVFSIPFLSTGFSFLALREFEYTGVFLGPVAAWWITTRLAPLGARAAARSAVPKLKVPPAVSGAAAVVSRSLRPRTSRPTIALMVVAILVTGGSMVPLSTRDQFATNSEDLIDSPMYINASALAAAEWASEYLSRAHSMWGDYLVYTVFGGFGDFRTVWDSYLLFNGSGFSPSAISELHLGSYVVVDTYLTTHYAPPTFPGPATDQPTGVLPYADIAKFQNPAYFDLLYENEFFTIYDTVEIPPAS
jgi:hypothetical protein